MRKKYSIPNKNTKTLVQWNIHKREPLETGEKAERVPNSGVARPGPRPEREHCITGTAY